MKTFHRLLGLVWPLRLRVLLAASLGAATVGGGMGLMATAAFLIGAAALHPSIAELQVAIVGVRFFGVARSGLRYAERLLSHGLSLRLLERLRVWFFAALEPLAPARTLELASGDLLVRAVADVESLRELFVRGLAPPLVALLVGAGTAAFLARFDALLAVTVVAFLAVAGVAVPLLDRHLGSGPGRRLTELRARLTTAVVDALQGMAELLACGRAREQLARVNRLGRDLERERSLLARLAGLDAGLEVLLAHGAVWCLLLVAIPLVGSGALPGVTLAVLALLALSSFEAVTPLPAAARSLAGQLRSADRLFELLDARPAVAEPAEPVAAPAERPLSLAARGLGFTYHGATTPALDGLSFAVPPGCRLAVVGPSGAGKSTLVRLLLRFWDPSAGCLELGGHDLRRLRQEDLRRLVGVVPQETHLFTGTVRDNLLLARPEASAEELRAALAGARLDADLAALPAGLDTSIGEQGLRLSGGQRQRLSIARTLLRNPPLLVLDEPFANLDPVTEQELLAALYGLMAARTTLLVTHRLAGMERMDDILVLDRGRLVERGTHRELRERGGLYRRAWEAQRVLG